MKTHLANPTEQEALCGRSTGVIKHLGTNRLVALTDDKCRSCLKTATYTSIYFTDASRTRLLSQTEVAKALGI